MHVKEGRKEVFRALIFFLIKETTKRSPQIPRAMQEVQASTCPPMIATDS